MKTENLIQETLKGLLDTAKEKVCVLGLSDSKDDLKQIRDLYIELIRFWGFDNRLVDEFDEQIGIRNVNYNAMILRRLAGETSEDAEIILSEDIESGTYKVKDVLQYIADRLE